MSEVQIKDKAELVKMFRSHYFQNLLELYKLKIEFLIKNRKKRLIKIITSILFVFVCVKLGYIDTVVAKISEKEKIYIHSSIINKIYKTEKSHQEFLNDLAMMESSGDYDVVKKEGDYWGRYQLGRIARTELGLSRISQKEFLSNHLLQDGLVTALLIKNKNYLSEYIGKYEGRTVGDIYITQSGILAGAHLRGFNSVIKFLESDGEIDEKDGNNVPVSKYMKMFTNYNLQLN